MADKKYVRRDLVAREIMKHAKRLFAEKGFEATSLHEIAAAVGVTRSALYYYADSKEALLVAVVEGSAEEVNAAGLEVILQGGDLRPTERLRQIVANFVLSVAADPERWQTLARCAQYLPPAVRKKHEQVLEQGVEAFKSLIAEGIASGEFRPVNPDISARGLLGMCQWVVYSFSGDSSISAEELADELAELALRSVGHHDTRINGTGDVAKALGSLRDDVAELEQLLRS
jgi:AcrR family transcriptional regulator